MTTTPKIEKAIDQLLEEWICLGYPDRKRLLRRLIRMAQREERKRTLRQIGFPDARSEGYAE